MKTLKQIYKENRDVRESEIPPEWIGSFNKFMLGSACLAETNEDGSVKEFIYYNIDFRQWYNINKAAIERDERIDKIIKQP